MSNVFAEGIPLPFLLPFLFSPLRERIRLSRSGERKNRAEKRLRPRWKINGHYIGTPVTFRSDERECFFSFSRFDILIRNVETVGQQLWFIGDSIRNISATSPSFKNKEKKGRTRVPRDGDRIAARSRNYEIHAKNPPRYVRENRRVFSFFPFFLFIVKRCRHCRREIKMRSIPFPRVSGHFVQFMLSLKENSSLLSRDCNTSSFIVNFVFAYFYFCPVYLIFRRMHFAFSPSC